jgi:hypothetical protein
MVASRGVSNASNGRGAAGSDHLVHVGIAHGRGLTNTDFLMNILPEPASPSRRIVLSLNHNPVRLE